MAASKNRRRHAVAALLYVALVTLMIATAWSAIASLGDRQVTVRAAEEMLAQLGGRTPAGKHARPGFGAAPAGSPFLEGQTVTVAGAALLQRIAGAVSKVGGNVLSSQVELQKADAKDGWIGLVVSCELEQSRLQPLLYDLEAGMPFLFVDQLVVQAPVVGVEESRMRILLAVSSKWGGGK
jgi:general secretion pathway protein M